MTYATLAALWLGHGQPVTADPPLTIALAAPDALSVGERRGVEVVVREADAAPTAVFVSAQATGEAMSVVRARLLRSDAVDPEATTLRFEVPVAALTAGASVLTVRVLTYRCAYRCRPIEATATQTLAVHNR